MARVMKRICEIGAAAITRLPCRSRAAQSNPGVFLAEQTASQQQQPLQQRLRHYCEPSVPSVLIRRHAVGKEVTLQRSVGNMRR